MWAPIPARFAVASAESSGAERVFAERFAAGFLGEDRTLLGSLSFDFSPFDFTMISYNFHGLLVRFSFRFSWSFSHSLDGRAASLLRQKTTPNGELTPGSRFDFSMTLSTVK